MKERMVLLLVLGLGACDEPNECEKALQCIVDAPYPLGGVGTVDERWLCIEEATRDDVLGVPPFVAECEVLEEDIPTNQCDDWLYSEVYDQVLCAF